ncbi:MAG: BrnT family toxin [Acetobacteraceae bacterium]|nr:BrnT family toxin [Acetobacteraceae bacterium]
MQERDLSFELVHELAWETALILEDSRRDYGETRLRVLALIGNQLHAAVVTPRGDVRVISLRKANRRERQSCEQQTR